MTPSLTEIALIIGAAFALGWFCAITSGALFSYIVFRTKKEQHERLFPAQPKKRKGPVNIDEFAFNEEPPKGKEEELGLPPIIKAMNERIMAQVGVENLKKGER